MNQKLLHRIFAAVVFIIAAFTYFSTMQPTVSFWDCGEFTASAYLMQVPHPPGTPFFLIIGRLFSMIPFADNIGLRLNMVSVLSSAFTILFLYLVAVKVNAGLIKLPKSLIRLPKIEVGMTWEEVTKLLGQPIRSISGTEILGTSTSSLSNDNFYAFEYKNWEFSIRIANGKVVSFKSWQSKESKNVFDALILFIPAAIGALSFAFSDTFWFNAVESEVYATSTFFIAFVVWLMVIWNEKADEPDSEKYLVFIFYLIGLSTGVHLMSVLAIIPVMMTVYFRKYVTDDKILEKTGIIFVIHTVIILVVAAIIWASQTDTISPTPEQFGELDSRFLMIMVSITALFMGALYKKIFQRNSFYIPIVVGGIALMIVYPGLVKYLPKLITILGQNDFRMNIIAGFAILAVVGFGVYWSGKNSKPILNLIFKCLFFAIIGSSSFIMIIIRANQEPPINMNSPKTFTELESYINREQYGDFPIFKRRYSNEAHQQNIYTDYSSDLDFLWKYQLNHMFNRYVFWNYIGRESTYQDSGVEWSDMWGIPFFIGLFGLYYHFRKDWKMASVFIMMFIFLGYLTVFYQNQQQPQPRERDYFYVGAFFVFSLWIAIGMRGIIEILKDKFQEKKILKPILIGVFVLGIIGVPVNMAKANWFEHNRARNYVPWDYAYNLLQSVAPNAILFTNGDNDTFPLWYIQNVEGVRRDVRVACLSLVNTPWYVKQLKNTTPFGSQKVEMSLSDEEIDHIGLQRWDPTQVSIDVPPDVMKEWNITDSAAVKDKKIKWLMKNTGQSTGQSGEVIKFIRGQDIVALDIIMQAKWKRPVYFAVTCSDDSKLNLDDYIEMEGMAMRVVPKKNDMPRIEYINEPILRKQLFDQPSNGFSKDYQPGFLFRGLNDKAIFFDENHERLTQNYRNAFMRLALHYLYKEKSNEKTINAIEEMEKRIPRSVIPMDYRIKHDISKILYSAGDMKLYEIYAREVITETKKQLELNPRDFSSWYNPYDLLLTHYDNLKMYKEAVGVLQQLQIYAPNDESVRNLLNEYRKKAGIEVSEVVPKQLNKK